MKKLTYDYVKKYIEREGYQLLSDTYINKRTKLQVKCSKGHVYEVTFSNFKYRGSRCPYCINKAKLKQNYVKTFIEKERYLLLNQYINAKTKLLLKCPEGHEYNTLFNTFKRGHRCPYCVGLAKLDYDYVKSYIEDEGYQLLSDTYINCETKLLIRCPEGHDYNVSFHGFSNGSRCPVCNLKSQSKGENELQMFIESLGINIIRNDRTQIINPLTNRNLELDVWIPSLNKAIEYNGEYWHSFPNSIKNDQIKSNQCKEKNIDLLIIGENDWINNNKQIKEKIKLWLC